MAPSLGEQVLHQDLVLHKILQYLSNVYDLRTIQGLVSLHSVKILSRGALKEHLARYEGIQHGVHYEEFEKPKNKNVLGIGQTDVFGTVQVHTKLYQYMESGRNRYPSTMLAYIRDIHRDHKIPYPKDRMSLKELKKKKKKDVLSEYRFLTYVPLSIYKIVRRGLAAQKLLRSARSMEDLHQQEKAFDCFYDAFLCGLDVDLVKPLVSVLCPGRGHIAQHALISASLHGHVELVAYMVESDIVGVDEALTDAGTTVLHFAAQGGHLDVVRFLVEKAHAAVNIASNVGKTPFMIAAEYGHIDIIEYLAHCDAVDVNGQHDDGVTGLMLAVDSAKKGSTLSSYWISVIKCLVEKAHVDVDKSNNGGMTALVLAVSHGLVDIVQYLIEAAKTDINKAYEDGLSVLMFVAAFANHISTMRYLVEDVGVDINASCRDAYMLSMGPMMFLVPSETGVLTFAVMHGHLDMVKYVIETGRVNVNATNHEGATALMAACRLGHMDIIKYLVEKGKADVYATNSSMDTCVTIAAEYDRCDIVKYLIEACGEEVLEANGGKNALDVAAEFGSTSVVTYLISTGEFDTIRSPEEFDTIIEHAAQNRMSQILAESAFPYPGQFGDSDYDDDSYSDDPYMFSGDYMPGTMYSDDEIDFSQMIEDQFHSDDSDDDWRIRQYLMSDPDYRSMFQEMNRAILEEYRNFREYERMESFLAMNAAHHHQIPSSQAGNGGRNNGSRGGGGRRGRGRGGRRGRGRQ